jgi:hypothetical protein
VYMCSASSFILLGNFQFPPARRSCMTHRQALPATTRHQCTCVLRRAEYWLLQSVDAVRCTVFDESYVKCGAPKKCRRKFRPTFPGNTVPMTRDIHEFTKRVISTGPLLDNKHATELEGTAATL